MCKRKSIWKIMCKDFQYNYFDVVCDDKTVIKIKYHGKLENCFKLNFCLILSWYLLAVWTRDMTKSSIKFYKITYFQLYSLAIKWSMICDRFETGSVKHLKSNFNFMVNLQALAFQSSPMLPKDWPEQSCVALLIKTVSKSLPI